MESFGESAKKRPLGSFSLDPDGFWHLSEYVIGRDLCLRLHFMRAQRSTARFLSQLDRDNSTTQVSDPTVRMLAALQTGS